MIDDSNTKALLHFTGTDTSITFTDESGKTWTRAGNAQIDTALFKFAPSSLLLDGTGDYISTPNHTDFSSGSGDLTIDFWEKYTGGAGLTVAACSKGGAIGSGLASFELLLNANYSVFNFTMDGTWDGARFFDYGPSNALNGGWHHIAVVKHGRDSIFFIDGIGAYSNSYDDRPIFSSSQPFYIGTSIAQIDGSVNYPGCIDEFRYSRVARWIADFSPPSAPYGAFVPGIMMIG